jgi:F-box interacting protein
MDIISRLPEKSLVRFKSVSKSWCSLASKALQLLLHSSNRKSSKFVIISKEFSGERAVCKLIENNGVSFERIEIAIPLRPTSECVRVLCSCYGLLCMSDGCRFFYLWNPSTKKFRSVAYPPGESEMMTTHGIGPDLRTRDILLIRIIKAGTLSDKKLPRAEVYSLNTNSWSRIESVPCFAYDEPTTFFDGAIHWKAINNVILYFNTAERVFRMIKLPVGCFDHIFWYHWRLAVLIGSLAFIVLGNVDVHPASSRICDIWIMDEYGVVQTWTKLFTIPLRHAFIARPLGITLNDQLLLDLDGELICYDLYSQRDRNFHGAYNSFPLHIY